MMNIKVDLAETLTPESMPERRVRSEGPQSSRPVQSTEDQLELSHEAQSLSSLKEKAMAATGVRTERIEGIMKQIQEGSYTIDSKLIAERMIQDHIGG
jgi:flagellar biosynthesis anti-sigma factor FlgM